MARCEIDEKLKENEVLVTLSDFKDFYNSTIPDRFTQASVLLLKQFKVTYPALFKGNKGRKETWSVLKHRKKVMDWISTQDKPDISK